MHSDENIPSNVLCTSYAIFAHCLQFNIKRGGQRVATFLMFLTEAMEGGETYFPWVCYKHAQMERGLKLNTAT